MGGGYHPLPEGRHSELTHSALFGASALAIVWGRPGKRLPEGSPSTPASGRVRSVAAAEPPTRLHVLWQLLPSRSSFEEPEDEIGWS